MMGGDWSLVTEHCNAILRATIAEGELYILKIERGGKMEIASWAAFFPPCVELFGTQVSCTFVDSFQTNQITLSPVKLSGILDLTNFSKSLNLNYSIGTKKLYVFPSCCI